MKSGFAVALLITAMSLCNLTDKSKPEANSNSSNKNAAETQKTEEGDHQSQNKSNRSKSNDAAPDRAALTVELMKLEYELTTASFAGDISTLATFVADDYSGTGADGK